MRQILTSQGIVPATAAFTASPARRSWLKRLGAALGGGILAGLAAPAAQARSPYQAQGLDPFLGEITMVAFTFAPQGWALCNGQILPIAQYQALFALLGTTYGGDGRTTFALPDLRGRVPLHAGQGPGLSPYSQGQIGGEERHTLSFNEMPQHTHSLNAIADNGNSAAPNGNLLAIDGSGLPRYSSGAPTTTLSSQALGGAGNSQPHNNLPPYLTINFIIALQGVFPSRP